MRRNVFWFYFLLKRKCVEFKKRYFDSRIAEAVTLVIGGIVKDQNASVPVMDVLGVLQHYKKLKPKGNTASKQHFNSLCFRAANALRIICSLILANVLVL